MDIKNYLLNNDINQSEFGRMIGKTRQEVGYWINKDRVVPIKIAVRIEQATKGQITRKEMRKDWKQIWPELENK